MRTDTARRNTHRNPPGFVSYLARLMDMLEEKQQQTEAISGSVYREEKGVKSHG